jgi:alcohol dehydrogenase class IV
LELHDGEITDESAPAVLARWVADLAHQAGLVGTLTEARVPRDIVPRLADAALQQWTIKFNPVEISPSDCRRLYESAL